MDPSEFKDSPSGTLIPTINGQMAFVPNPLPPTIDYGPLMESLSAATLALGELNGIADQLDNPYLVIRPLQRREALLSSSMEGTHTTANALALAEADEYVDDAAREVRNYIRAFDYAERALSEIPVSNRLIKGTHSELLSGLPTRRGANKRPGEFKDQQNFIGGAGRRIEDARFIPPPPRETELAMAQLENFLNRENTGGSTALLDAALMHYQFETIHPFSDGNGRVGRILIPILLKQRGLLHRPLLYISPAVEGRKDEYVDLMLGVSREGRWTEWLTFFFEMTLLSCRSAIETARSLIAMRNQFRTKITEAGGSARFATLSDHLFVQPVISIPHAAEVMGVSYPAAQNAVKRLVDLAILKEFDSLIRPKLFVCHQVVDAIEP